MDSEVSGLVPYRRESVASASAPWSWSSLPPEIQLLILELVVSSSQKKRYKKGPGIAIFAGVSRGWQCFIERNTFRRLVITNKTLDAFAKAVKGKNAIRLGYIRHLWLRIKLSEYTCHSCRKPENGDDIARALEAQGEHSITSNTPLIYEEIQRFCGTPLELRAWPLKNARGCWNPLPILAKAPVVKGFIIRRRCIRGIEVTTLAQLFRQGLVEVEWFRWEKRVAMVGEDEAAFFANLETDLIPALPHSLKRLYLSDWFPFHMKMNQYSKELRKSLAQAMATLCHRFTELCPPEHVSTLCFLQQLSLASSETQLSPDSKPFMWANLELLSLRARSIRPDSDQRLIDVIIYHAGKAATCMPRLRIMEIWNVGPGYSYLFQYRLEHHQATITWRTAGGEFHLLEKATKPWAQVASERTGLPLSVVVDPFPETPQEILQSLGKCILRHLALLRLVMDPVTFRQFENEAPCSGLL
ncbi:hypothetical protein FZEAL_9730 [Fusarium zealandicum]|uniref:DUF6546 domain-containing protein n=1 Tax=Fusarium zealandicum TaxID=1053134 RepID=A0A8H4U9H1_9HYPO|nr:hypothetical protein FZEAL_9730 [Fusarium zealandicum]